MSSVEKYPQMIKEDENWKKKSCSTDSGNPETQFWIPYPSLISRYICCQYLTLVSIKGTFPLMSWPQSSKLLKKVQFQEVVMFGLND